MKELEKGCEHCWCQKADIPIDPAGLTRTLVKHLICCNCGLKKKNYQ